MPTELELHIQTTPLCDTHEHLQSEQAYVTQGPDILQNLFANYITADLIVAGASQTAIDTLLDPTNPDLRARFAGIQTAWEMVRHTGYGEAVQTIARELYTIDELTPATIEAAQPLNDALCLPGQRLHLLRERANLDHVQIDNFCRPCRIDPAGPDFFFYDISWRSFCCGTPDLEQLAKETGIEVHDLNSLQQTMEAVMVQNASFAVAIKSQHAYNRTLHWQARTPKEATRALAAWLHDRDSFTEEERLCLGDWCTARGVELAIEHDLPIKLHTGYYAGHSRMPVDYISAGKLTPLLTQFPQARFVLMHIAYPYSDELVALAKHYPNVYVDLCWAWSVDPYSTRDFVRRFIHAVPANKLFVFGGDTFWPGAAVAYAHQARTWLNRALQAEVDEHLLSEKAAMTLASRFMRENQNECFRLAKKKQQVLASSAGQTAPVV